MAQKTYFFKELYIKTLKRPTFFKELYIKALNKEP